MTTDDIKKEIAQRTGIPEAMLSGDTADDIISYSKALLAYRRETEEQAPLDAKDQFIQWMNERTGQPPEETPEQRLDNFAEDLRLEAGGYPRVPDGGTAGLNIGNADNLSTLERFKEWLDGESAFDPLKGANGWKRF